MTNLLPTSTPLLVRGKYSRPIFPTVFAYTSYTRALHGWICKVCFRSLSLLRVCINNRFASVSSCVVEYLLFFVDDVLLFIYCRYNSFRLGSKLELKLVGTESIKHNIQLVGGPRRIWCIAC